MFPVLLLDAIWEHLADAPQAVPPVFQPRGGRSIRRQDRQGGERLPPSAF